MANNTLKYRHIDPQLRAQLRAEWNHPITWPIAVIIGIFVLGMIPAIVSYRARLRAKGLN